MSDETEAAAEAARQDTEHTRHQPMRPEDALGRIHKAAPSWDQLHCATCGQWIRQVPGGQGMTWVHADSGAVVAPNPPVSYIINQLITHPERYVLGGSGTYADGYLDALLDVLTGLGLLHPDAGYRALREQIMQQRGADEQAYWQAQAEAMRRQEQALREQPEATP